MQRIAFILKITLLILCSFEWTTVQCNKIFKTNELPLDCGRSRLTHTSSKLTAAKITGGKEARKGEFPWMVAVFGPNGKLICGASLISNLFAVSASHCFASFKSKDLKRLTVTIGDHNIRTSTEGQHEFRKIQEVILHKDFDSKTYNNDISLLKLDKPVRYTDFIQPICIPRNETRVFENIEGSEVVVAGWGRLTSGVFGISPDTLRKVEIPVWKFEECRRVYNRFAPGRLMDSHLCAGDGRKNKDACIGDSGGPLMIRSADSTWYQVGTVSWGKGCGSFPGVYTDTRKYTNWIQTHLN